MYSILLLLFCLPTFAPTHHFVCWRVVEYTAPFSARLICKIAFYYLSYKLFSFGPAPCSRLVRACVCVPLCVGQMLVALRPVHKAHTLHSFHFIFYYFALRSVSLAIIIDVLSAVCLLLLYTHIWVSIFFYLFTFLCIVRSSCQRAAKYVSMHNEKWSKNAMRLFHQRNYLCIPNNNNLWRYVPSRIRFHSFFLFYIILMCRRFFLLH